jgi:hypothetical protein
MPDSRHARSPEARITHASAVLPACPDRASAAYVQAGRTPAPSQARWLRLAEDEIDAALLRADARRNVLAIARVIGWSADWRTGRSRPTVARLMEVTGLSRRCVQNWLRWIEQRGLLDVTEPGTTPRFRPGILHRGGSSNLAREWRLVVPVDPSCIPSWSCSPKTSPTRARARETGDLDRRSAPDSPPAPPRSPRQAPMWPPSQVPQRRSDRLAAAEALRRDHLVLRRVSARAVRSAVRIYFCAGWTPADVAYALDFRPDGRQHIQTEPVRSPARWLACRLSWWLGCDGCPVRPHSAELRELVDRARSEAASDRARLRRKAPGADPGPYAEQVRADLAARRQRPR